MRQTTTMRRVGIAAAAGTLLIVSGTTPMTLAGKDKVKVVGIDSGAKSAGVTLQNVTRVQQTGTLVAEVELEGRRTLTQQRFKVSGGNKVFVSLISLISLSPGPSSQAIQLGVIVDDGAPF